MAFKGDLESVPLGDLLQTLHQNGKEGTLVLDCPDCKKSIYCNQDGITLPDPEISKPRRFGDIVVSAGLADRATIEEVAEGLQAGQRLGQALVDGGYIDQALVERILALQIEEEIYGLFELTEGEFEFFDEEEKEGDEESEGKAKSDLPLFRVEGVALEAARRQDEWNHIRKLVGDLYMVFIQVPGPLVDDDPQTAAVMERVNGKRTIRNIADSLFISPFEAAKTLAQLAQDQRIRPASKQELLNLAQDLIDEDEIESAGIILKKLRPDLENLVLDERDVSVLANLFYKAGDILTATNILLEKVREVDDSNTTEDSLPWLEQAQRIAPEDTRILNELARICARSGDEKGRQQHLASLVHIHIKAGRFDQALETCNEIMESDPTNDFVIENLPTILVNTKGKKEAVTFLEEIVQKLGKKAEPKRLTEIYHQILKIDPSRKDINDKLRKTKRSTSSKKNIVYIVAFVAILAGGSFSWYLNVGGQETDMDRVGHAALLFSRGDVRGARNYLMEAMATITDKLALTEAETLLTTIEARLGQGTQIQAEIEKKEYFDQLKSVKENLEAGQFAKALKGYKELAESFDALKFGRTTKQETARAVEAVKHDIARLQNRMDEFTPPVRDEDIAGVLEEFRPDFNPEKGEILHALLDVLNELSSDDLFKATINTEFISRMESVVSKTDAMIAEILDLEKRQQRLDNLTDLSHLFDEAKKNEEEGRLDEALRLYTRLANEYGEGHLAEMLHRKRTELEGFFNALKEVEELMEGGEVQKAYQVATGLLDDHPDPAHIAFVKVPVLLTSIPEGASIQSKGRSMGNTPRVVYLQRDQVLNILLEYEGYEREFFVIETTGGAVQTLSLNRLVDFTVKLGGVVEAQPLLEPEGLIVASRSGIIFRIDPESGDIMKKFNTGSLSGIPASVLVAYESIYFNTMEGKIWALTADGLKLKAKTELSAGTRCSPLLAPGGIITACLDGTVTCHDPALKNNLWTYKGGGRILTDPVQVDGRLYIPFTSGNLVCLDMREGKELWRRRAGAESVSGMTHGDGLVVLGSKNGWVKGVDIASGDERWRIELDSYVNRPPVMWEGTVFVVANKDLVLINAAEGKQISKYSMKETITCTPAVTDGNICFGTEGGNLHFRKIGESQDLWVHHATDTVLSTPLITKDRIFVSNAKGLFSSVKR